MSDETVPGPLDGIRVVDMTRILAGPFCTMLLGDMGADVIKVERPGAGDDTRGWGPPFVGAEAAYFLGVNRNKRSVTLNLRTDAGRDILARLFTGADVVVENFKLGTLAGWGFDAAWFAAEAPQLVHASIQGYGSTGPRAGLPGYDFLLQAESGLMSITGEADGAPMKLGVAIVDICTGLLTLSSILAALQARARTGKGQHVETSLYDTGVSMLANVAANFLASGEAAWRYGNGHPNIVPYNAYATRDGMIALSVGNDEQFARFAATVGEADWAADPRFARNRDRVVNRAAIDALIGALFATRDTADWLTELQAAGISASPINDVEQALGDPHTLARGLVAEIAHGTEGPIRVPGTPLRFSRDPAAVRRPPPALGEHTDEVLGELGLASADIADLRANEIV